MWQLLLFRSCQFPIEDLPLFLREGVAQDVALPLAGQLACVVVQPWDWNTYML